MTLTGKKLVNSLGILPQKNLSGMQEIEFHKFAKYSFDKEKSLFVQIWTNPEGLMTVDEFKEIMTGQAKIVNDNGFKHTLVIAKEMNFTIPPTVQDWVNSEILPIHKKIAFVMPSGFFEQVAIRQTMEDNGHKTDAGIYFDNEEDALAYLMH